MIQMCMFKLIYDFITVTLTLSSILLYYSQAENWPSRLLMQLMPKQLIGSIGQQFLKDSKSVSFHPSPCESLENLTKTMSSGFVCFHFYFY